MYLSYNDHIYLLRMILVVCCIDVAIDIIMMLVNDNVFVFDKGVNYFLFSYSLILRLKLPIATI